TKSAGSMNFPTLTSKFSTTPYGNLIERSASWREILVGFTSSMCIFLIKDNGIRLMLAPKSQRAFSMLISPIVQGIKKLA
ncbi:hypothetical protein, partial [Klebsiella pneumoniae]|uniref:hypothetical protein n=1 Tax=Klebsiella pneumoniae TaxID=573 RepID=UPI003014171C